MNDENKQLAVERRAVAEDGRLTETYVNLAVRLGALVLLLYIAATLVWPFISIILWSIVLAVALHPSYEWMTRHLGGRRRLAAAVITVLSLLVVIGPAIWLVLGLIDSMRVVAERLDVSGMSVPAPPDKGEGWPLIGEQVYGYWTLASTNLSAALGKIAPQLRPLGASLLHIAADAGVGVLTFFAAIVVAGFLFSPAPVLVDAFTQFSRRLVATR